MSTPDKYLKKFEDFGISFADMEPYFHHLSCEQRRLFELRWKDKSSPEKSAEIFHISKRQVYARETSAIKRLELVAYQIIIDKKFRKIQADAQEAGNMTKYWECEHEIAKLLVEGKSYYNGKRYFR